MGGQCNVCEVYSVYSTVAWVETPLAGSSLTSTSVGLLHSHLAHSDGGDVVALIYINKWSPLQASHTADQNKLYSVWK